MQAGTKDMNRVASAMRAIREGVRESSIIRLVNNTRNNIHPTQKPVRLIERLLQLVTRGGLVLDPFSGSGSCRIACHNLGLDFIGCEIDKEYFDKANERFEKEIHGVEVIGDTVITQQSLFDETVITQQSLFDE